MDLMLGVDVGGTKIAVAGVTRAGEIHGEVLTQPTEASDSEGFRRGLVEAIQAARAEIGGHILGVGLGCAGTVDWAGGRIVESPNLPIKDEPLRDLVADALDLPVVLDNDANVAALAEARVGVGHGLSEVVMLTLGTGVGGGMVLNGHLYRGANGSAGELGHTVVLGNEEPCLCGRRGCLEMYASGSALIRFAREIAERNGPPGTPQAVPSGRDGTYAAALRRLAERDELDGESIGRLALEGDQAACEAVGQVARWLGVGLANFANIFNPQMIVIGGGLSELGELLLEPARALMRQVAISPNGEVVRVEAANLGPDAGVVGAALVAWEELAGEG